MGTALVALGWRTRRGRWCYWVSGSLTFVGHPDLARLADHLWDVLGLLYRRRYERFKLRFASVAARTGGHAASDQ